MLPRLLAKRSVVATPATWTDPDVQWSRYDLVVLRSPWDYADRRAEFLRWAARVPRLANPLPVVRWNTDKRYLIDLDTAGVPVVPTGWVGSGEAWHPPQYGQWVIKPAIGAGSRDTGRYRLAEADDRRLAVAHVRRLQQAGRLVMVQPYLSAVDTEGETALIYFSDGDGGLRYSHAIRKGPMLTGPDRGVDGLAPEQITDRTPTAAEQALAQRALAAVPGGVAQLLYARVDLIPGPDGEPVVVELELTEPSLFLAWAAGAAQRFAAAIAHRVGR